MGNCQAVDAAALVIQHPNGNIERMYWSIKASEVMKMNPGHYVSLIIPLPLPEERTSTVTATVTATTTKSLDEKKTVRYTRVKLLRPSDTLVLGRAYRLVTSQEVKKVLRAKKLAKTKMNEMGSVNDKLHVSQGKERDESEHNDQVLRHERQRLRSRSMNSVSKTWRPSLKSISESAS